MSLLAWREQFEIGLPEVDHEHHRLIDEINALHARAGAGATSAEVSGAIGDIHASIAAHFALEERTMVQLGYPGLTAHKEDHERLLDEILDIMDQVAAREGHDPAALGQVLSDWFAVHFRTEDAGLHHWLVRRS